MVLTCGQPRDVWWGLQVLEQGEKPVSKLHPLLLLFQSPGTCIGAHNFLLDLFSQIFLEWSSLSGQDRSQLKMYSKTDWAELLARKCKSSEYTSNEFPQQQIKNQNVPKSFNMMQKLISVKKQRPSLRFTRGGHIQEIVRATLNWQCTRLSELGLQNQALLDCSCQRVAVNLSAAEMQFRTWCETITIFMAERAHLCHGWHPLLSSLLSPKEEGGWRERGPFAA